jgi:hypothetical protein
VRSPIQQWLPIVSFQGKCMFTRGLITRPAPTSQPKTRSRVLFKVEGHGQDERKKTVFDTYHATSTALGAPRSNLDLSNKSFRTGGEVSLLGMGDDGSGATRITHCYMLATAILRWPAAQQRWEGRRCPLAKALATTPSGVRVLELLASRVSAICQLVTGEVTAYFDGAAARPIRKRGVRLPRVTLECGEGSLAE